MGYILPSVYKSIAVEAKIELPNIFIETGTFKGGVAHRCLETQVGLCDFAKWYTIEIGEDICKIASQRYKNFEKYNPDLPPHSEIHTDEMDNDFNGVGGYFNNQLILFHGDSTRILPDLLDTISEPCCFWLDAHAGAAKYSGDPNDVPLLKELEIIGRHEIKNHIIAIDDAHLFGTNQAGLCDYTNITEDVIAKKIKEINKNYQVAVYAPFGMNMIIAVVNGKSI